MKPCPYCQTFHCQHEQKFFAFALTKIVIIQKSVNATCSLFSALVAFLPSNTEMQRKLNLVFEDLYKCKERIEDVKNWYETQLK